MKTIQTTSLVKLARILSIVVTCCNLISRYYWCEKATRTFMTFLKYKDLLSLGTQWNSPNKLSEIINGSPIPNQKTRPNLINKKRTWQLVDFAVPADYRVKVKKSEKLKKYLNQKTEKTWNMRVKVIAIIVRALGVITKKRKIKVWGKWRSEKELRPSTPQSYREPLEYLEMS